MVGEGGMEMALQGAKKREDFPWVLESLNRRVVSASKLCFSDSGAKKSHALLQLRQGRSKRDLLCPIFS